MRIIKSPLYSKSIGFLLHVPSTELLLYTLNDTGSNDIYTSHWSKAFVRDSKKIDLPEGPWENGIISPMRGIIYLESDNHVINAFSLKNISSNSKPLWKFRPDEVEEVTKKGYSSIFSLSLSPNETYLLTTHTRGFIIFNTITQKIVYKQSMDSFVQTAAFCPKKLYRIVVCSEKSTMLIDFDPDMKSPQTRELPLDQIQSVNFSADGSHLALGSKFNYLHIWYMHSMERAYSYPHKGSVNAVCFVEIDNSLCIATASSGGCIRLLELEQGYITERFCSGLGHVNCSTALGHRYYEQKPIFILANNNTILFSNTYSILSDNNISGITK